MCQLNSEKFHRESRYALISILWLYFITGKTGLIAGPYLTSVIYSVRRTTLYKLDPNILANLYRSKIRQSVALNLKQVIPKNDGACLDATITGQ